MAPGRTVPRGQQVRERLVDRRESDRAVPTTLLPSRALEHGLLVDVFVQMAKVLVESKRVRDIKTGDPETTQSDSSGSR
jgi:hypothetical protein